MHLAHSHRRLRGHRHTQNCLTLNRNLTLSASPLFCPDRVEDLSLSWSKCVNDVQPVELQNKWIVRPRFLLATCQVGNYLVMPHSRFEDELRESHRATCSRGAFSSTLALSSPEGAVGLLFSRCLLAPCCLSLQVCQVFRNFTNT